MARKFLTAIDLGTNELQNAVIQNLAAASEPTGVKGRIYFDSTNNIIKFYDGSTWKGLATGGDLSAYVTLSGTETLSNKTISDSLTFYDGSGSGSTVYATGSDLSIYAHNNLYLNTNNSNIVLQPDGNAYIWSEQIATQPWVGAQGYLTSETDPVYTASSWYTTTNNSSNWDTAYGWGNHASAGYLTSAVTSIAGTTNQIAVSGSTGSVTVSLPSTVHVMSNISIGELDHGGEFSVVSDISDAVFNVNTHTPIFITSLPTTIDASAEITGNLTVQGDLTVNGDVTTLNTATMNVEDNIFLLNSNVTGTPAANAGLEVERGDYTNASIYWNETANLWYVGTPADNTDAAVATAISLVGHTHAAGDITGIQEYVEDTVGTMTSGSNSLSVTYTDNGGSAGTLALDTTLATTSYLSKSSGLAVDVSSLETKLTTDGYVKKYAENNSAITISGGVATWAVTHGLSTRDVTVQVYTVSGYEAVEVDVVRTSTSVVTLTWNAAANVSADTYRVVVTG